MIRNHTTFWDETLRLHPVEHGHADKHKEVHPGRHTHVQNCDHETTASLQKRFHRIYSLKKTCSSPPGNNQHGVHHGVVFENNNGGGGTTFYSKIIETLASKKLIMDHVVEAEDVKSIDPLPEVEMRDLKYISKTIKALHRLTFNMMINNQTGKYSALRRFMATCVDVEDPHVHHKNLYLCSFVHSCAKTCKQSLSMRLVMFHKPLRAGRLCMYSEGGGGGGGGVAGRAAFRQARRQGLPEVLQAGQHRH